MSRGQAATLAHTLGRGVPAKTVRGKLSREEADRRIEALRQEIALANSF
jgi:hypothetical protein